MRYYAARQRQSDKKWDFTCRNGDYTQPVGYCCAHLDFHEGILKLLGLPCDDPMISRTKEFKEKHHTCGHDTQKEAEDCYREYLLDKRLRLKLEHTNAMHPCVVCKEWTPLYAEVDTTTTWDLCEKHNTYEEVEKLFKAPAEIWCS